jgi:hypothetical protein
MNNTVPLQVPEGLYQLLTRSAQKTGKTPEELALQWLVAGVQNMTDDPIEEFIGAFRSDVLDRCDQGKLVIEKCLKGLNIAIAI